MLATYLEAYSETQTSHLKEIKLETVVRALNSPNSYAPQNTHVRNGIFIVLVLVACLKVAVLHTDGLESGTVETTDSFLIIRQIHRYSLEVQVYVAVRQATYYRVFRLLV